MVRKPTTPGSVIAAAVFLFITGGFGLICGMCGVAGQGINQFQPNQGQQAQVAEFMDKEAPGFKIEEVTHLVLNVGFGALMIAAGVGVLRLMSIARWAAYFLVAADLLHVILHYVYLSLVVLPATRRFLMQHLQQMPVNPNQAQAGKEIAGMVGNMTEGVGLAMHIGLVAFWLTISLLIVIFLSMKSSRDAFADRVPESFGGDDRDDRDDRPRRYEGYDDDDDDGGRPAKPPKAKGDTGTRERPD